LGSEALTDRHWERQRRGLIERIRETGVDNLEVLRAFDLVPRHLFLPESVLHRAYEDSALPIGFGQTASQPSIQALYLQLLEIQPRDRVLEVGTGSGYQTALLAQIAEHVYSIERVRELSVRARAALDQLRLSNVALLVGDGTVGWSRYAPYNAILVSAGAPQFRHRCSTARAGWTHADSTRRSRLQKLTLVRKTEQGVQMEEVSACVFVPLLGRFGWAV
jgi:protein-L-isoaspartate(D-aspartate) O-methyltransferase